MVITSCKIFPGIGVARLGNSPEDFFLGPEVPGIVAATADGRFKDAEGRVKRQAARFRIFGFDRDGAVVAELTSQEAEITWEVELANTKGAFFEFQGLLAERKARDAGGTLPLRNKDVADTPQAPNARDVLRVRPGSRSIRGNSESGFRYRFRGGTFLGTPVDLGELRTDEGGRLLVLGGAGRSGSVRPGNPLHHYANNDGWFDDTSDGPVRARVTLRDGGAQLEATPAWVICAPPDFAPSVSNVVRLYDVMQEAAVAKGWLPRPERVSFTRDVLPILARPVGYQWVNAEAARGHAAGFGNFLDPAILTKLADRSDAARDARRTVFARLRTPGSTDGRQAVARFMPALSGDNGDATDGDITTWLTLLESQYRILERWAEGDFDADLGGAPPSPTGPLESFPVAQQPELLVRAALEPCVGGAFFPGIEMTYIARDPALYSEPFRLRAGLAPGDITRYMALPWQADFYECREHWWPAQRPDEVLTSDTFEELLKKAELPADVVDRDEIAGRRARWDRGIGNQAGYEGLPRYAGDNDMVEKWSRLGFLVPKEGPGGKTYVVETERGVVDPYATLDERDYFRYLMNIDAHPEFLPKARELAHGYLVDAARIASAPDTDPLDAFFPYTPAAFAERLDQIYEALVEYVDSYDPSKDEVFTSRARVLERVRQFAPFNQTDGAWLHNISRVGPVDEVIALLFSVWADEIGNGDASLNHANLYTDLLRQNGVYLPEVTSLEYARDPRFLTSAFTVPVFQLSVAQFSEEFLPELLGMTLQLEWEVVGIKRTMKLLEHWGFDTHFYRMHVGIDNASTGHGAKARRAIELFLDHAYRNGGDDLVQGLWRRIWNGRVAFAYTGNLGRDLADKLQRMDTVEGLQERVVALVKSKAHYARFNHGDKKLAGITLNQWFDGDPEGLVRELATSAWIFPGDPLRSPFFDRLTYEGPMYKVFTEEEVALLQDWVRSLGPTAPQPEPEGPADAMVAVIERLRSLQEGTPGHEANSLTGPDPADASKTINKPVAFWFKQPARRLMEALAHPASGVVVRGNPAQSAFVTRYLDRGTGGAMAAAFDATYPEIAPKKASQVVSEWIQAGCPLPTGARALRVLVGPARLAGTGRPHWRTRGMGEVH